MRISYHRSTIEMLDSEPRVFAEAEARLADVENSLGVSLPPSVREWYSFENAIEILAESSNEDPPIPLRDFAAVRSQSRVLLPFRVEDQGVCTWSVALDGTDDPPVYVDVDSDGKTWRIAAPKFSTYIYSCVWDYRMVFRQKAIVQAQNRALSPFTKSRLAASFRVEVETYGWPGQAQLRFQRRRRLS